MIKTNELKSKKKQGKIRTQAGITLVALVITIIVIIILSTVTISTVFRRWWNNKESARGKRHGTK